MAVCNGEEEKRKEPAKRCVVMFCDKTNARGVSVHKFPTEENSSTMGFVCSPKKRMTHGN